jgi:hypothetical protein
MSAKHPTKRLRAPDGSRADIDIQIVPLLQALWNAGYETIGSCQDTGESAASSSKVHGARWKGYVLLEMPVDDACTLLETIKETPQFKDRMHWASDGAWSVTIPVLPYGQDGYADVGPWAQIRFPKNQVDDLVHVLF